MVNSSNQHKKLPRQRFRKVYCFRSIVTSLLCMAMPASSRPHGPEMTMGPEVVYFSETLTKDTVAWSALICDSDFCACDMNCWLVAAAWFWWSIEDNGDQGKFAKCNQLILYFIKLNPLKNISTQRKTQVIAVQTHLWLCIHVHSTICFESNRIASRNH